MTNKKPDGWIDLNNDNPDYMKLSDKLLTTGG